MITLPKQLLAALVLSAALACANSYGLTQASKPPQQVIDALNSHQFSTVITLDSPTDRFNTFRDSQDYLLVRKGDGCCLKSQAQHWSTCFQWDIGRLHSNTDNFVVVSGGPSWPEHLVRGGKFTELTVLDALTGRKLASLRIAASAASHYEWQEILDYVYFLNGVMYYQLVSPGGWDHPEKRVTYELPVGS